MNSRSKGQRGERELCELLAAELGISLARTLNQARDGGPDIELPGFAIEVKRGERFQSRWIEQAVAQAGPGRVPVLAWRQNRRPWQFMVLADLRAFADHARSQMDSHPQAGTAGPRPWRNGQ